MSRDAAGFSLRTVVIHPVIPDDKLQARAGSDYIYDSSVADCLFRAHYDSVGWMQERLLVLGLNSALAPVHLTEVCSGTLCETMFSPAQVYAPILRDSVVHSIILAHNHPSMELTPSRADVTVTERVRKAGKLLGVPLVDHLILSPRGYITIL